MDHVLVQVLSTATVISSMFAMIQWVRADITRLDMNLRDHGSTLSSHKDDHAVHCKHPTKGC